MVLLITKIQQLVQLQRNIPIQNQSAKPHPIYHQNGQTDSLSMTKTAKSPYPLVPQRGVILLPSPEPTVPLPWQRRSAEMQVIKSLASANKNTLFFLMQVTTRVFLVWAYHLVDDAGDPRDFSMHSRRGHTSESYRLVYENNPTDSISDQHNRTIMTSSPKPSTPAKRGQKSLGVHLGFSSLVILLTTVWSFLV